MAQKQVVIRRSLFRDLVWTFVCIVVSFVCILAIFGSGETTTAIGGIFFLFLFGGSGGYYFFWGVLKPIVVISSEGIAFPQVSGEKFLPWKYVDRFEQVNMGKSQNVKAYIAVFVKEDLRSSGEFVQKTTLSINEKAENHYMIIGEHIGYPYAKFIKIKETLQEFHDEYTNRYSGYDY
jgi:hypothetical protein